MHFNEFVASLLAKKTGLNKEEVLELLEQPPEVTLGDVAFPCFVLAKKEKKSPNDIAVALAQEFKPTEQLAKVRAVGPYLNFFAIQGLQAGIISLILEQKEQYGKQKNTGKCFGVEFFSPNTHKSLHIGHVRNASFGETLSRIFETVGHKVLRLNYPADVGPHIAKCLWLFLKRNETPPKERRDEWLAKLYVEATTLMKTDAAAEEESKVLLRKIYDKDLTMYALWKETRQWCLDEFDIIYKELGVKYDHTFFESEMELLGRAIANDLLGQGIAEKSQGAIIINLEKENLGIFVILTQDGRALYSSKDMALARVKFKELAIDESFYIVGKEQERHFQQVFASLRLMGEKKISEHSHHIAYELVTLSDGTKMSSREGNTVLYNDLKDRALDAAKKEIAKRRSEWEQTKIDTIAKQVAFAAIKFQMLNRDANKKILFDMTEALDFEGETGPYILYTYARICSLFRKYDTEFSVPSSFELLTTEEEKLLIQQLQAYPEVISSAALQWKPLLVARYTLELAQHFNRFYQLHPVLQADTPLKEQRLALCAAVKQVLKNATFLLGIEPPEEM